MPCRWAGPRRSRDRHFVPGDKSDELKAVVFLLLLFALIALLPDFEREQWDGNTPDAPKPITHPDDPTDDRRI